MIIQSKKNYTDLLKYLPDIKEENEELIVELASNVHSPKEVFLKLHSLKNTYIDVLIASNPGCPIDLIENLASHSNDAVRLAVARNESTPIVVLNQLSTDANEQVKNAALGITSNNDESLDLKKEKNTIPITKGNLFDHIDLNKKTVIFHICNDEGGYGRGFAKELAEKYPRARTLYKKWFKYKNHFELGNIQYVKLDKNLYVINMLAQHGYKTKSNPEPLDYKALRKCLKEYNDVAFLKDAKIIMPKLGTGLAGGDWEKIQVIISDELKGKEFTVYDKKTDRFKNNMQLIYQIPIVEYARDLGLTPIRKGSRYYSLAEADSVMIDISKNIFFRNSKFTAGFGGVAGGIVQFVKEFDDTVNTNQEAITKLSKELGLNPNYSPEKLKDYINKLPPVPPKGPLVLPEKDSNMKNVYQYLLNKRCLEQEVVDYFVNQSLLYQDKRKNCVWVTHDDKGNPNFASLRSTGSKKFALDVRGCDYDECFYINHNSNTLFVTEAIIDQMSLMSKMVNSEKTYKDVNWLSINGTNKIKAIFNHLDKDVSINKLFLAFDNDEAGREASNLVIHHLNQTGWEGSVQMFRPYIGKDWNQYLQYEKAYKSFKNEIINKINSEISNVFDNPSYCLQLQQFASNVYRNEDLPDSIKANLDIISEIEKEDQERHLQEYKKKNNLTDKMTHATKKQHTLNNQHTKQKISDLQK